MSNEIYRDSSFIMNKFGISMRTLDRWVKNKKIIPVYLGNEKRFTETEIERFEKENIKSSDELIKERMKKMRDKKDNK